MKSHPIIRFVTSDHFLVLLLFIITTIPRILWLDQIPLGLHGDEAWTGIDARRILQSGLIEPYTKSAFGQPTGPIYITALFFRIFGDSIFTLRLSMSFFGIITIPVFYALLRLYFDKKISFLSSVAFSLSLFHLHYSRLAFMLISAPFFQILSLYFLAKFLKDRRLIFSILCGAAAGIGLYSYNGFVIFPVLLIFFNLILVLVKKNRLLLKSFIVNCSVIFILALPLLIFVATKPEVYFGHFNTFSVFNQISFKSNPYLISKLIFLAEFTMRKLNIFFLGNKTDYADGYGSYFSFNISYLFLFILGFVISSTKKSPFLKLINISAIISLFPLMVTIDGDYRRQIIFLPYFFFAVALALAYLFQNNQGSRLIILTIFIGAVAFESTLNLNFYFRLFPNKPATKEIFAPEITSTISVINKIKSNDSNVFIQSSRWGCGHETIRFLLPKTPCQDTGLAFNLTIQPSFSTGGKTYGILYDEYLNSLSENRYVKYIPVMTNNTLSGVIYEINSERMYR